MQLSTLQKSPEICPHKLREHQTVLRPLTPSFLDNEGRIIKLWISAYGLIASVFNKSHELTIIPSHKISTPLIQNSSEIQILQCLINYPYVNWDLVYDIRKKTITIWPHLKAAGRPREIKSSFSPFRHSSRAEIEAYLVSKGFEFRPSGNRWVGFITHKKSGVKRHISIHIDDGIAMNEPPHLDIKYEDPTKSELHSKRAAEIKELKKQIDENNKNFDKKTAYALNKELQTKLDEKKSFSDFKAKWRFAYGQKPPVDGPKIRKESQPAIRQFQQTLQQTKLVDSYKAANKDSPIPAKAGAGSDIGGVACSTAYMEGLFDTPESLFETDHFFFLPQEGGSIPFSNEELRQIMRELAIGVYVHSTIPFFSLHFNQSGELFPVIHPVYKNTLVGRVIGMLDYIMKGYLNGGVFKEEFVDQWVKNPKWSKDKTSTFEQMIDFEVYCQQHLHGKDSQYVSVRELQSKPENSWLIKTISKLDIFSDKEEAIFNDYTEFSNSFRIISNQKSYQKEGNLFYIDADFDVQYTIAPSPKYNQALDNYLRKHGQEPSSYVKLKILFKHFRQRIHDHMVKFPLCKQYFSMLHVISFLSGYYTTLKKYRKIPVLESIPRANTKGCPTLFPHLPLRAFRKINLRYIPIEIFLTLDKGQKDILGNSLNLPFSEQVSTLLVDLIQKNLIINASPIVANWLKTHNQSAKEIAPELHEILKKGFIEFIYRRKATEAKEVTKNLITRCSDAIKKKSGGPPNLALGHINDQAYKVLKKPLGTNEVHEPIIKFLKEQIDNLFDNNDPIYQELEQLRLFFDKIASRSFCIDDELNSVTKTLFFQDNVLKETFKDGKLDRNLQATLLVRPEDMTKEEALEGKRVVGGCGLKLNIQKVQSTPQTSHLISTIFPAMLSTEPQTWQVVKADSNMGRNGAFFRLEIESMPPWSSDYSWMENALLVDTDDTNGEDNQLWQKAQEAIEDSNLQLFDSLDKSKLYNLKDLDGRTLLHVAATQANPHFIRALIEGGLSDSIPDNFGFLPVHYAAMNPLLDSLKLLIKPSNVHSAANDGSTPLVIATQHGHLQNVTFLLSHGARNVTLTGGYNILHCALHNGHVTIAKSLLSSKIISKQDLNICAEEGGTPLMMACELENLNFVIELVAKGAKPEILNKQSMSAIEIAIKLKNCPILEFLLTKTNPSDHAIETACRESSKEIIAILIKNRRFLSYRSPFNDTPLFIATRHANLPAAQCILEQIEDSNYLQIQNLKGETALDTAIKGAFWEFIPELIAKGATSISFEQLVTLIQCGFHEILKDILRDRIFSKEELKSLVQTAAASGNYLAISMILRPLGGSLEEVRGPDGWDIAHYLAKYDGIFLFKDVMKSRIDMSCRDQKGKTLAYIAAENDSKRVLRYLLEQTEKPLLNQYQNHHLIYGAISSLQPECLSLVLELGNCSLNEPIDDKGSLPVHLAAQIGSKSMLKLLVAKGATINKLDHRGFSPLYYALRAEATKAIQFLLSKEASVSAFELYAAASQKNPLLFETILKKVSNVDILSAKENSTLMIAVLANNQKAALRLIKAGADPHCLCKGGWTPFLYIAREGHITLLQALSDKCEFTDVFIEGKNALDLAYEGGHTGLVELLVRLGYKRKIETTGVNSSVNWALGFSYPHQQNVEAFFIALSKKESLDAQNLAKQLPTNERITYVKGNLTICATPVQLLLHCGLSITSDEIAHLVIKDKLDPNLPDSEGNTLAHLMAKANLSPEDIPGIDVTRSNFEKQKPVHLAAGYATVEILKSFMTMAPNDKDALDRSGQTPFFYALKNTMYDNILLLARKGVNLNHRDFELRTPLHLAFMNDDFNSIKLLCENGADVNQPSTTERLYPLHLAMYSQSNEFALLLIFHGAKSHVFSNQGLMPLHITCQINNPALLKVFNAQGVNLQLPNKKGSQAIHFAAMNGTVNILNDLALEGISVDTVTETYSTKKKKSLLKLTPLFLAVSKGEAEAVKWLIDKKASLATPNETCGLLAKASNSLAVLNILRNYKLTEDPLQLQEAAEYAIRHDNPTTLRKILSWGLPIDTNLSGEYTALHLASHIGAVQCTQLLLELGINPYLLGHNKETALEIAAKGNSSTQFLLLLEWCIWDEEFQIDQTNNRGETLCHIAANAGNLPHLVHLVDNGCNIEIQDVQGRTPLKLACREGRIEAIKFLIAFRASYDPINLPEELMSAIKQIKPGNTPQDTPLHFAVQLNEIYSIMLLSQLHDVNHTNPQGETPLHLAVALGQMASIRQLFKAGAKVNVSDKSFRSPLSIACLERRNPLLVQLLLEMGADPKIANKQGDSLIIQLKQQDFPERNTILKLVSNSK